MGAQLCQTILHLFFFFFFLFFRSQPFLGLTLFWASWITPATLSGRSVPAVRYVACIPLKKCEENLLHWSAWCSGDLLAKCWCHCSRRGQALTLFRKYFVSLQSGRHYWWTFIVVTFASLSLDTELICSLFPRVLWPSGIVLCWLARHPILYPWNRSQKLALYSETSLEWTPGDRETYLVKWKLCSSRVKSRSHKSGTCIKLAGRVKKSVKAMH